MRSIIDPMDALGMEDEYRRSQEDAAGGVTTAADVMGIPRGIDQDVLDGFEGEIFEDKQPMPMPEGIISEFRLSKGVHPDSELAYAPEEMVGGSANHERRIVFDCQGRRVEVQFAKLRHYLTKPCAEPKHNHRAFYATVEQSVRYGGANPPAEPSIPCRLAPRCTKMFSSIANRDDHFRNRHQNSFRQHTEGRRIENEDSQLATNAAMLKVLTKMAEAQGVVVDDTGEPDDEMPEGGYTAIGVPFDGSALFQQARTHAAPAAKKPAAKAKPAKKARAVPTKAPRPEGTPAEGWKVYHITDWLAENGHPLPKQTFPPMKLGDVLAYAQGFVPKE